MRLSSLLSRALYHSFSAAVVAAAGLVLPAAAADYVWLSRDGARAVAQAGSLDAAQNNRAAAPAPQLEAARAFLVDGKDLPVMADGGAWYAAAAPRSDGDLRFTARAVGEQGALLLYQARYGRAETKPANDLELVPTEAGGNTFRLFFKGRPVAASQVNVATSEGWRRVLRPDADGAVTLATPFSGLYVLEVTARVNGAATIDGKQYEDVRHVATLSFDVPAR
ncbi:hypothetical protein [Xylophilus sp.]|uniref:hypothetical protein n=1 Tax=Xylophilus sp. TaxID=2653893 RepID=UPI0013BC3AD1|nr:hypothetical protein [Xylophilus sp.]KAF1042261.1 MAG: hypothetical protein GAK38_04373 [Xylophilus sp.]